MSDFLRIFLVWLPAAIFSFHSKLIYLGLEGYRVSARRLELESVDHLGAWQRLGFFRLDILLGLVAIPIGLWLAARVLPRRLGLVLAAAAAVLCLLVQYVQIRSFLAVGQFLSLETATSALQWARENPGDVLHYDTPGSIAKLGFLLAAVFAAAFARTIPGASLLRRLAPKALEGTLRRHHAKALLAAAPSLACLVALPWMVAVQGGAYDSSMLAEGFRFLLTTPDGPASGPERRSFGRLMVDYRTLAGASESMRDPRWWGAAKGYNLVFFVIESGPSACLPLEGPMDGFPALEGLRERSLIGLRHHSTYPYTNRAVFSMFTSMYPSSRTRGFLPMPQDARLPGVARSLAGAGYASAAYFPIRQTFESDELLFKALGVAEQRYPSGKPDWRAGQPVGWKKVWARDMAALNLLVGDIAAWGESGSPFMAAFFPQVGHGPWEDVRGDGVTDVIQRGRNLIRLQDAMLGRILDALRKSGQEGRTLIVVTGDHGLRTRLEYPDLPGGMADSISFHVPLLIHAPGVFQAPLQIPWLTSHIDVGPTVLELLGIGEGRQAEQGLPLWDERIDRRTTFFFGKHYFGADAYHEGGEFFMWSHPTRMGYRRESAIHFPGVRPLPDSSRASKLISGKINRMASLQDALLRICMEPRPRDAMGGCIQETVFSAAP